MKTRHYLPTNKFWQSGLSFSLLNKNKKKKILLATINYQSYKNKK